MDIEYNYLKAKKITDNFENKLSKKHEVTNIETLYFELRKRTHNVEAEIDAVQNHINGYFDKLILGYHYKHTCSVYMYLTDYSRNINENKKFKDKILVSMMYKDERLFEEWFSNIHDAINFIQQFYLKRKENNIHYEHIFQTYYLKLNDIILKKEEYLL